MRDLLNEMLASDTGQSIEKLQRDTDRDYIMARRKPRTYGVIDEVITDGRSSTGGGRRRSLTEEGMWPSSATVESSSSAASAGSRRSR